MYCVRVINLVYNTQLTQPQLVHNISCMSVQVHHVQIAHDVDESLGLRAVSSFNMTFVVESARFTRKLFAPIAYK